MTAPRATMAARVRHGVGIVVTAATALLLDLWLRVAVLHRFRHDETRKAAGITRVTKTWAAAVFGLARFFLGLRVRIEGAVPSAGRYLVVSNHQSSLDIPLLISTLRALDLRFVAMEPLRRGHPVISAALRHGGAAFVKKESLSDDLVELARFGRVVDRLQASALIFPEGGLARDGALRPFRPAGIEAIRAVTGLPLLPVTVEGLWPAPTIKEYVRLMGARITVRVGDPVSAESVDSDPRGTYERIETSMRGNLEEMRRDGEER